MWISSMNVTFPVPPKNLYADEHGCLTGFTEILHESTAGARHTRVSYCFV